MNLAIIENDVTTLLRQDYIPFQELKGKSFLVTGGTGLVGCNIIHALCIISQRLELDINVTSLVRSKVKAKSIFPPYRNLKFIEADVATYSQTDKSFDYILHIASPTASNYFVTNPVELIDFSYHSTKNLLELARILRSHFIYFSSMEVYGTPGSDEKIDESFIGSCPDTCAVRSSYSEGKRLCENMCTAYNSEYGVKTNIMRLAQTFGPGASLSDNRVFAQFAHSWLESNDIILQTTGDTKRSYLYPMDMVSALLTILLKGESGKAYNVANESTYCTIKEMADFVATRLAAGSIKVHCNAGNSEAYPPNAHMNLDTSRLKALGWKANWGLEDIFRNMISFWA